MTIKRFEFNMFPVNCYVLSDETKEAVIIDAGCYYAEERELLKKYIDSNELKSKHLLNTHLHLDHIFGNTFVYRTYGLKPEASQEDEFWIVGAESQAQLFGIRLPEQLVGLGGYITDGQSIKFGNTLLEAIHVPGHSPGGMAFYCKQANCLFTGDSLFRGSIGRADLTGGNFDQLREHLCSRILTLPPETMVYPGHGDATTIGNEKINNPFLR